MLQGRAFIANATPSRFFDGFADLTSSATVERTRPLAAFTCRANLRSMRAPTASSRGSSATTRLLAALALGCGATADSGASGGDISTSGADTSANPPPSLSECPERLGDPDDLAATPRADENLEFLALAVESDGVVVSQANYERVVADVAAIRALLPELAPIEYRPPHDGRSLQLSLGDAGIDAWAMGAFDCLNEAFGAMATNIMDNFDFIYPLFVMRGIYDMPRVAQLYEQVPQVNAELLPGPTDGPTWCIGRNGSEYEYVIDRRANCVAVCQEHEAHHFSSAAAGEPTPLAIWRSAQGEPPPGWYTRLCP
jgi:hypothetical protein